MVTFRLLRYQHWRTMSRASVSPLLITGTILEMLKPCHDLAVLAGWQERQSDKLRGMFASLRRGKSSKKLARALFLYCARTTAAAVSGYSVQRQALSIVLLLREMATW